MVGKGLFCAFLIILAAQSVKTNTDQLHVSVDTDKLARKMWLDADKDGDGVLNQNEVVAIFDKYDTDHNSRVTKHEYSSYLQVHSPELVKLGLHVFDEYDSDGDHRLDAQDYQLFYQKMDLDHNGVVSEADFVAYWIRLLTSLKHVHPYGK